MDLSFSFSPHPRRASKFEFPFPKGESYSDNVMPVRVPLGTDTSNAMFDNTVDYRVPRWMLQRCSSKASFAQKSNNESACSSKVMIPKIASAAISITQQTIVGGFVGSKSYAGRSIFGEHSQIWDVIFGKIVELMSPSKDNPIESKSMYSDVNNTKICDSSCQIPQYLIKESLSNKISDKVSGLCSSPINIPERLILECVDSPSEKVLKGVKPVSPGGCDNSKSILKESIEKPSSSLTPSLREKYSSVVNGTCRNGVKSVTPESSSVETSPTHGKPGSSCMVKAPSPLKQSYAEVAKTIPPKPLGPQSRVFCRDNQNHKKKSMRSRSNKYNNKGGSVWLTNKPTSLTMGDIIAEGDTRWNSKARSKRLELQKSRPIPVLSRCGSSSGNESAGENSLEFIFCEDAVAEPQSGPCVAIPEKVPLNGCLRGRRPSESSVDSEDSFVVFASSPESTAASPCSTNYLNTSVELDEESDDESISSSEYSSSEDDDSGDNVDYLIYDPSAGNNIVKWEFYHATTITLPENRSKEIKKKKVRFAEGSSLAVVKPMIAWSYAYREARRGNWEVYSRDRARFQCRIHNLAPVLNLVLDPVHRKRIFESRFVER